MTKHYKSKKVTGLTFLEAMAALMDGHIIAAADYDGELGWYYQNDQLYFNGESSFLQIEADQINMLWRIVIPKELTVKEYWKL